MMELLVLMLLGGAAYLSAIITATLAVYRSTAPEQMIHMVLNDTYAMTVVALLMWWWIPHSGVVLWFLTIRAGFLAAHRWQLIYDNYNEIKRSMA